MFETETAIFLYSQKEMVESLKINVFTVEHFKILSLFLHSSFNIRGKYFNGI